MEPHEAPGYPAPPPRDRCANELEVGPGTLRVGVTTEPWSGVAIDPEAATAAMHAGRVLDDTGHPVGQRPGALAALATTAFACPEEDSNLHPVIPHQALTWDD
jgi:hypothetical protein